MWKITTLFTFITLLAPYTSAIRVFSNPVIPGKNLPDPGAIYHEGDKHYYVVNTGGSDKGKFTIHKSVDLQNWDAVGDAIPNSKIPSWAEEKGSFWAPEIHKINGNFRLVFAATEKKTGRLCVGIASADKIEGPYTDIGVPAVYNATVGSIDPSVMTLPDKTYYLIWKDDGNGNTPHIPTWIKAQKLNSDGLTVTGPVYYLIANTLPWEGAVTEGPWIMQRGSYYYLFYSGADYCDNTYAVGVARSQNPLGPYEKFGDPILKSNSEWVGPGHCSVLGEQGKNDTFVMVYHSWKAGHVCTGNDRYLMVDYVYWTADDWPYMKNSSPTEFFI